jgi:hypothetical protein
MVVQPIPGVKARPTDNDTMCKIIGNSHMKCCGIFFGFCNPFFIFLSASTYSKVPKQSRVYLLICEYKPVL